MGVGDQHDLAAVGLHGPAALLDGMDESLIEVVPLYAGECVREIGSIVPAAEAVKQLTPS